MEASMSCLSSQLLLTSVGLCLQGVNRHLVASHDLFKYNQEPDSPQTFWVTCRQDVFDQNGDIYCPETRQMAQSEQKVCSLFDSLTVSCTLHHPSFCNSRI